MFSKYDLDHNKRISKFEFQDILRVLTKMTGAPFPTSIDVEDIFTCLDRDGDETISFSEFQQLFKSFAKLMDEEKISLRLKKEL